VDTKVVEAVVAAMVALQRSKNIARKMLGFPDVFN